MIGDVFPSGGSDTSRKTPPVVCPASAFVSDLGALNGLDRMGFFRFIFYPGMLFGSSEKWWGVGGSRPSAHEGLDLCFFEARDGRRYRLDETVRVPAAVSGRIVRLMDDFLGRTVVVESRCHQQAGAFYTFYAHIRPDKALQEGDTISAGTVFATISPIRSPKVTLPPHLHITMAAADALPPVGTLSWPMMNRLERSVFFDPLDVLSCEYIVEQYSSVVSGFTSFEPVGCIQEAAGNEERESGFCGKRSQNK